MLTLPKQIILVYLGVLITKEQDGSIEKNIAFAITGVLTVLLGVYIWMKMRKIRKVLLEEQAKRKAEREMPLLAPNEFDLPPITRTPSLSRSIAQSIPDSFYPPPGYERQIPPHGGVHGAISPLPKTFDHSSPHRRGYKESYSEHSEAGESFFQREDSYYQRREEEERYAGRRGYMKNTLHGEITTTSRHRAK
jgi:hypothetical protein